MLAYLPTIRSYSPSITVPSFSLINALTVTPKSVPQSSSLTITSCETSTSLLVKYPDDAVFSAVSADPFLALCVERKNSDTDKPYLNDDITGI